MYQFNKLFMVIFSSVVYYHSRIVQGVSLRGSQRETQTLGCCNSGEKLENGSSTTKPQQDLNGIIKKNGKEGGKEGVVKKEVKRGIDTVISTKSGEDNPQREDDNPNTNHPQREDDNPNTNHNGEDLLNTAGNQPGLLGKLFGLAAANDKSGMKTTNAEIDSLVGSDGQSRDSKTKEKTKELEKSAVEGKSSMEMRTIATEVKRATGEMEKTRDATIDTLEKTIASLKVELDLKMESTLAEQRLKMKEIQAEQQAEQEAARLSDFASRAFYSWLATGISCICTLFVDFHGMDPLDVFKNKLFLRILRRFFSPLSYIGITFPEEAIKALDRSRKTQILKNAKQTALNAAWAKANHHEDMEIDQDNQKLLSFRHLLDWDESDDTKVRDPRNSVLREKREEVTEAIKDLVDENKNAFLSVEQGKEGTFVGEETKQQVEKIDNERTSAARQSTPSTKLRNAASGDSYKQQDLVHGLSERKDEKLGEIIIWRREEIISDPPLTKGEWREMVEYIGQFVFVLIVRSSPYWLVDFLRNFVFPWFGTLPYISGFYSQVAHLKFDAVHNLVHILDHGGRSGQLDIVTRVGKGLKMIFWLALIMFLYTKTHENDSDYPGSIEYGLPCVCGYQFKKIDVIDGIFTVMVCYFVHSFLQVFENDPSAIDITSGVSWLFSSVIDVIHEWIPIFSESSVVEPIRLTYGQFTFLLCVILFVILQTILVRYRAKINSKILGWRKRFTEGRVQHSSSRGDTNA